MTRRQSVTSFREKYRVESVPADYNGTAHAITNVTIYSSVFALGIAVTAADTTSSQSAPWIGLAIALIAFNVVEYSFHRWISHKKRTLFANAYRRHAGAHHPYFANDEAVVNDGRDLHAILLPISVAIAYLALFSLVFGAPFFLTGNFGYAGGILSGVALSVFQLDFLHLYFHLPEESNAARALARVGYLRSLRRLHKQHHAGSRPTTGFNITHPLSDLLFGTLRHPSATTCERKT